MPSISGMAIRHSSAINGALSGAAAASKAAKINVYTFYINLSVIF